MAGKLSIRKPPNCIKRASVACSRLFEVERLSLQFSNGEKREYERLACKDMAAVLIVPIVDEKHFLLIREYACGTERYELGFPKGLLNPGETIYQAANRELMEEVGMGANRLSFLTQLSSSPSYFGLLMDVVLAQDLYEQKLEGDEPEPVEVIKWSFDELETLLARDDFSEARSIATLFLVKQYLEKTNGK